jgi:hypothetical protein
LLSTHWLLFLAILELMNSKFEYGIWIWQAPISLACLLVDRHQTTSLLVLEAALSWAHWIWLTFHASPDASITLKF